MSVISFILVLILVSSRPANGLIKSSTCITQNLKDGINHCIETPFLAVIGLTESLLFACLHIFIFSWSPVLRSLSPSCDTGSIFTLFMIALIVGGFGFKVSLDLEKALYLQIQDPLKLAKFVSGLSMLAFLTTNLVNSFQVNLIAFLIFEVNNQP